MNATDRKVDSPCNLHSADSQMFEHAVLENEREKPRLLVNSKYCGTHFSVEHEIRSRLVEVQHMRKGRPGNPAELYLRPAPAKRKLNCSDQWYRAVRPIPSP